MFSLKTRAFGAISKMAGVLAVGFLFTTTAQAVPFTFKPGAAGLSGSDFSADALKATEVSHIAFDAINTNLWTERGYAQITGAVSGGNTFVPTGLNSTYSLYFEFGGTGDSATGTFTDAYMKLYGVNGAASFSYNGATHQAEVATGANTPVLLSNSSLIVGTTRQTFIAPGPPPQIDFFAVLLTTFAPTVDGVPFFQLPYASLNLYGDFYHDFSGVYLGTGANVDIGGNTVFLAPNEVVLVGGNDTLTFVPEPGSLLLFAAGLPALRLARRRAG